MTPERPHLPITRDAVRVEHRVLWGAFAALAVVLPWINPFSSGPRANTIPWLVSAFCGLMLLAGYTLLHGNTRQRKLIHPTVVFGAWLAAALLSSTLGLLQYFGLADSLSPWINFAPPGSAFANLRQRNQFASLTSIGLVSALFLAARIPVAASKNQGGQPYAHTRWLWGLLMATLALLAMANAASASRTGALQWVMLAALSLLPCLRRSRRLAWLALSLYVLAVLLLPILLEITTGLSGLALINRFSESAGCQSRRVLWANVLELIAQKPWFGWGWGELKYAHFIFPYAGPRFCDILDNAHNLPLQLAVELGVPFATAIIGVLVWWVWRNRPWQETDPSRQAAWAVLGVIALHSMLEYPLWYGPFQMAVGLCLWLLWRNRDHTTDLRQSPVAVTTLAVGTTLITIGFLGYTAWDYTRISQLYLPQTQRLGPFRNNTLAKARPSILFAHEVRFAELTTFTLSEDTAPRRYTLAGQLLHFSPEPIVLQELLESAHILGLADSSLDTIEQQFQVAYPKAYEEWTQRRERYSTPGR